jgi:hypothetical protein
MDLYFTITVHYIDTTGPTWMLEQELLGFKLVQGLHSDKHLAKLCFEAIQEMGITKKVSMESSIYSIFLTKYVLIQIKVSWITTDNATNNDTLMEELEKLLFKAGVPMAQFSMLNNHIW